MVDIFSAGILATLWNNVTVTSVSVLLIYVFYTTIQRLYLSPIAHFPGPKLAALTWYYQIYYDIYPHYGQYYKHISHLHDIYGPIIRINPYELHVSSPDFFETLYSTHEKRDKWAWLTHSFGMPDSTFATTSHVIHKRRRAALNPYFSKQSVARLQPVVDERVGVLLERLRGCGRDGVVVNVAEVASAFSTDVIMTYAFGKSHNRLEMDDFGKEVYEAGHEGGLLGPVMMHFKFILATIQSLPNSVVKKLGPAMAAFVELRQGFEKQVQTIINTHNNHTNQDQLHPTVFHELLNSKHLPASDKSISRLSDEALSIISAGNETVSWALTVATYHILSNTSILRKLKTELALAIPDPDSVVSSAKLEQLPYLNAVYKEALRLSYGMSCRLQRIPHDGLPFRDTTQNGGREWVIPPGTPVSMTSVLMHHDESIFPNSTSFTPERWLQDTDNAQTHNLWKYMVSFGAGSRVCLGQSLASSEMHLWLAGVFRRFGSAEVNGGDDEGVLELVEGTGVEDVRIVADRIIPAVEKGRKGVRVRVVLNG